jgi:hypothetical protein
MKNKQQAQPQSVEFTQTPCQNGTVFVITHIPHPLPATDLGKVTYLTQCSPSTPANISLICHLAQKCCQALHKVRMNLEMTKPKVLWDSFTIGVGIFPRASDTHISTLATIQAVISIPTQDAIIPP